jgi:hypothetical protein
MMLSSRMRHGRWCILHLEPNQLVVIEFRRTSTNQMTHLTSIKKWLWKKDHSNKVWIMRKIFLPWKNGIPSVIYFPRWHKIDEKFITWMWRLLSWIETWKRMFSCLIHKVFLWRDKNKKYAS